MACKETISQFAKNFSKFPDIMEREVLRPWSTETIQAFTNSQKLVPVASGRLQGSGSYLRAKVGVNGIESSIIYRVPYAGELNDINSGIRLKNPGEISYYQGGTKVTKRSRGYLGFLNRAVTISQNVFVRLASVAASKAFNSI